ncbi:MAG: outer membrane beta-barrel protein [Bacteroidales bacterium]|jgi:hypothetical protein|nr:PorT family protein [Bacteroidales bacterium]MDD2264479.1 hypothetical protein [Bacteroidales bacterium]MDD2831714.1 hypothetical protein [Bacteroidales bacterium]MDD3208941.1 hypothetical protein [Bacteroidales bacterium]MDD3697687.1 hypothetical protein [Bacteroidales bacterium]
MLRLPLHLKKDNWLILAILLLTGPVAGAQTVSHREHMVGIRGGYAFNGVAFNPDRKQKMVASYRNASVLYTYYHDLWGNMPYFGLQTGFTYTQQGYDTPDVKRIYEVVRIPLTSQFHIDFGKMRLLINLGCFGSYRMSAVDFTADDPGGKQVVFDCNHIYADYGIQGGAGLALVLKPFEFHIEANYLYSLSMIENPALYSNEYYTYGYPNQLLFTVGIFIHL